MVQALEDLKEEAGDVAKEVRVEEFNPEKSPARLRSKYVHVMGILAISRVGTKSVLRPQRRFGMKM